MATAARTRTHDRAPIKSHGEDERERLTVAPIVGPEDPRRFTDSGIEIEPLYTEADLPRGARVG